MPLLSIIITVYNLENYIEECLQSVINQEIDDYEIVLVDNGSTDNSRKICESYAKKYKHINYIGLEGDSIIGRAHRIGIAEAKGTYLHILDGDDYVAQGCYSDIVRIIKEKEPDVVFGSFKSVPEKGAKNMNDAIIDPDRINNSNYEQAIEYIMHIPNFHMVQWRYIFKKSRFVEPDEINDRAYLETLPSSYYGDVTTTTRILLKGNSIYYYDKPFYYYRIRANGAITSEVTLGHYRAFFLIIFRLLFLLEKLECEGIRKDFVFSRIKVLFRLFLAGIDLTDSKEMQVLGEIIEDNLVYMPIIKEIEDNEIKWLIDFVSQYGSYEGIYQYCSSKKSGLLLKYKGKEDKCVFVFPSGHCGEGTARILMSNGIKVCGFLDNDEHKDGKEIIKLRCYLPSYIANFSRSQKNKTVVIISTIYDGLKSILKTQLLNLGIYEDNIIIKE